MSVHGRHPPPVSVIIPNYNGARLLEDCLPSLARQTYPDVEIIVVDNGSSDDSLEVISTLAPKAKVLALDRNHGFAGAVNAGLRRARGEWIAVLNNDTETKPDWLEQCVSALERHPDAAFFASRILDFSDRGRLYSAGDCFLRAGIGYRRGQGRKQQPQYLQEREVFSACGCAALYRKSALEGLGGFDEKFFAYLEDVELGLRLRAAGHRGFYVPDAVVFHRGGSTSGGEFSQLAVRLRTRNALLLILQSLPAAVILRSLPMILAGQASWLFRALVRGRGWSYLRGLAGVVPLFPAAMRTRRRLGEQWRRSPQRLWNLVLESEALAREDFRTQNAELSSLFLRYYFRFF